MSDEYRFIKVERCGVVGRIRLNRPDKANALSEGLLVEVRRAVEELEATPECRVGVLSGEGRGFSAGFDLAPRDHPHETVGDWRGHARLAHDTFWSVWHSRLPFVSAVHGYCLGGACELALVCDVAVAARGTRFGEPEIQFGTGALFNLIPWMTGMKAAKLLLLTGAEIDAEEALRLGMLSRVVAPDELEEQAMSLATSLATVPPEVMAVAKTAVNRVYEAQGLQAAVDAQIDTFTLGQLTRTEERARFKQIAHEEGFKAAYSWMQESHRKEIAGGTTSAPAER